VFYEGSREKVLARALPETAAEDLIMLTGETFKNPERIQLSIISSLEKRCLLWIAQRLPLQIHSDHLTSLGFLGMVLAGVSYWLSSWSPFLLLPAIFWLAVNWFGDSLDGTVARIRNRQRPRYGFYVDHVIDALGILFLFGGMALSGYMTPWITLILIVAYYLLSIEIYLATVSLGKFRMSFGIFGPTELRILLAIGNIALLFHPRVQILGKGFQLFDVGGVIAIAGLVVVTLYSAAKNGYQLYREEAL
jgi:phosphatidylglycerophosphate synthase